MMMVADALQSVWPIAAAWMGTTESETKVIMGALATASLVVTVYRRQRFEQSLGVPILYRTSQGWSLPFIGHGITFVRYSPWDLLTMWHRDGKNPIVCFPLLNNLFFSVASPSLCKAILQSKIAHVKKDVEATMKPFLSILGTGIVTSEGKFWLQQRLKMSHPLRRDILEIIPAQTLEAVQRLFSILDRAAETGELMPIGELLRHLTLQVISGSFLSLTAEESDSSFAKLYLPIVEESNRRVWYGFRSYCWFLPSFWQYRSNVYKLNHYVSALIRNRWKARRDGTRDGSLDILDRVLEVYEKEFPDAERLPEYAVRQFRDEMKTFMLAGHETSAAMMTWTLYELILDKGDNLLEQMRSEANTVFASDKDWKTAKTKDIPDTENLARLIFSEASLKESLRKYSVVPLVARRIVEDLRLKEGPYFLPKGSSVMVNIQALHLDPEVWPKPHKYDPSRFLPGSTIEPFTFIPFIAGPRNCLGQHLALLESKMVMSLLVQRYNFAIPGCREIDTADWNHDPRHRFMVPLIPREEVFVSIARRQ